MLSFYRFDCTLQASDRRTDKRGTNRKEECVYVICYCATAVQLCNSKRSFENSACVSEIAEGSWKCTSLSERLWKGGSRNKKLGQSLRNHTFRTPKDPGNMQSAIQRSRSGQSLRVLEQSDGRQAANTAMIDEESGEARKEIRTPDSFLHTRSPPVQ